MFYLPFFLALIAPPLLQSASIDLGQVFQPEEKYFTITATNTRTDPLVLQRLILTCPCFEGDMKEGTLRPGEGVSIEIKFRSLQENPGHLEKDIFIITDKGRLIFKVTGEVLEKSKKIIVFAGLTLVGRFGKSADWDGKFEKSLLRRIGEDGKYRLVLVRGGEERDGRDLMNWLEPQRPFLCSVELFHMAGGYRLNLRVFSSAGEVIVIRTFSGRKAERLMEEASAEIVRSLSLLQ